MRGSRSTIALALLLAACAAPAPSTTPAPAAPGAAAAPAAPASPVAPAAPAATQHVDLDNAADGTLVTLVRGAEVKVILDANASTGFQWQLVGDVPSQLSPIGTRIYVARADPRLTGAGGSNVFRFRGERPGQATLQFEYRRPWETGVPAAKTVRYPVTVR
ncbi:MAG: protease inhibitor I42 family protein [Burkholderiales bacterium]